VRRLKSGAWLVVDSTFEALMGTPNKGYAVNLFMIASLLVLVMLVFL